MWGFFVFPTVALATWVNSYKREFNFDANQDITTETSYKWDVNSMVWLDDKKIQFTYSLNHTLSDITNFPDKDFRSKYMLTNTSGRRYFNNAWVNNDSLIYFYSPFTLTGGQSITRNAALTCYPNPSNGILHIKSSSTNIVELEIYDLTGNLVYDLPVSNEAEISCDLSSLSNGIYFVRIRLEHGVATTHKILLAN